MSDILKHVLPYLACCLPLALLFAAAALAILLPIFKAPKVETVIRVARKRIDGDPNITRDQLRRDLRERYLPAWALENPEAERDRGLLLEFFLQMRWSLTTMVVDSRIDKALDIVRFDEEGGPPRRRRRRDRRD